MSAQAKQEELKELMRQADALMDKAKEVFFLARSVGNSLRNEHDAYIPAVIQEIDEAGGGRQQRKRRESISSPPGDTSAPVMPAPTPEEIQLLIENAKRKCSNCRRPGHRAKNCPEPLEVKPIGKRFCSVCRKPGHRSTTCPENK